MDTLKNNNPSQLIDRKLESIGAIYLDNFLMYQQRNYQGIQAERRYQLRDRQIKQMTKNSSDSQLLLMLISAHKGHHPVETYNKMKNMIIKTASSVLFELHELNKIEGTNFTIDDCINKVFQKVSKEEIVELFTEEQNSRGEFDLCPDFLSPNEFEDFKNKVSITEARILLGKEPFEESVKSEKNDGMKRKTETKERHKNIEPIER